MRMHLQQTRIESIMTTLARVVARSTWCLACVSTLATFTLAHEAQAAQVGPWGALAALRDDSAAHTANKPAGGWYVTPIHAVLRARDGKVVLTGTERMGQQSCNGTTQRNYGVTFVLDPAQLDAIEDGESVLVQPIGEQARDGDERHVLYCSGHVPLADGRILYVAGTDYPRILPIISPELGLNYSRMFDSVAGTFERIEAPMKGGQSTAPGMKWYPTNRLLPDGRVLIMGGYHFSVSGPMGTDKENRSLELFDPAVWDADRNADPYTVLVQPQDIPSAINTAGRAYTHVFLLPEPVPAAKGSGLARTVALIGSVGDMWLFNHEPGAEASDRMVRMPNAEMPRASGDKGEGSTSLMLPDGRVLIMSGGRDGAGAAQAYFYDPYDDAWETLDLGIARIFSIATWLPDGTVLLLNGYTNEIGSPWALDNAPGGADGVRKPQIIDPFAKTVVTEEPWPEPTPRGYHSFALLLKDGRVLIGGGKDNVHDTGCEKNEARIYSPPYLSAGTRPVISNVAEGQKLVVGGAPLTIEFSGTVRPMRGVALMAPGAVTHSYNQNQNYVPLRVVSGPANGSITVAPPATINEAPPGEYILHVISDEGAPSVGVSVRLEAPPACVYPVDSSAGVFIEAEGSSRRAGPFQRIDEAGRGNDAFIQVDPNAPSAADVPDEGNVMWYDLDVSQEAQVYLWLLGQAPGGGSGTLFVSVNGGPDQRVMVSSTAWGWTRAEGAFELPAGKQTLKLKAAEPGVQLDRIWLTSNDQAAAPDGLGAAPPEVPCSKGSPDPVNGGSGGGGSSGIAGSGMAAGGVGGAGGQQAVGGSAVQTAGTSSNAGTANAPTSEAGCGCRVVSSSTSGSNAFDLLGLLSVLCLVAARRLPRAGSGLLRRGVARSPRVACWLACGACLACGGPTNAAVKKLAAGGDSGGQADADAGAATTAGMHAGTPAGAGGDSGSPPMAGDSGAGPQVDPDIITGLEKTSPYPDVVYPRENPHSSEKALLGKILFWEEQLSSHDSHACGTCHHPSAGGSDPRAALPASLGAGPNGSFGDADDVHGSQGVVRCDSAGTPKPDPVYGLNVQVTARKAASTLDAWLFDELFWDGRASTSFVDPVTGELAIESGGALESQAAAPPVSSVEMSCEGYTWVAIESKLTTAVPLRWASEIPPSIAEVLTQYASYPALFEWAYGTPAVTAKRILFAIATYERQLRSDQTPWDRFNAGDADALTPDEQAGLALFNVKARCSTCHVPPLFTDNEFHNIGARSPDLDPGRSLITGDAADRGKMKTPSLRNVALRAQGGLLHFGADSGATLRSVLSVYRQGGIHSEHLDAEIQPLNLPDFELEQLLMFVDNGLTDPRARAELPPFDRPHLRSEQ
jgi:cytochrome c peroxidase